MASSMLLLQLTPDGWKKLPDSSWAGPCCDGGIIGIEQKIALSSVALGTVVGKS